MLTSRTLEKFVYVSHWSIKTKGKEGLETKGQIIVFVCVSLRDGIRIDMMNSELQGEYTVIKMGSHLCIRIETKDSSS
jgi:hypothetical protein